MNTEIPSDIEEIIALLESKTLYLNEIFRVIDKLYNLHLEDMEPNFPKEIILIVNKNPFNPKSYLKKISKYIKRLTGRKIKIRAKWIF